MADKDEEGTAEEPTLADGSTSAGAHAVGHPGSPLSDEVAEPSGDELAASGYDTAGRDDLADLDGPAASEEVLHPDEDSESDDSEKALEPVGAGAVGRSVERRRERRPAPKAKNAPTVARDRPTKPTRTTPAAFVRESVGELRKVVYPTGQQLLNYFVVVLVFVLFVIAYVSLLDLGLGWAIFKVFS
ncbi:preprotein translocase subunit SecE [uncultured Friedmanniella sp.]|uniref:preprotein translocase subunit SecE n=1 Tax=uncultured Friedmanniella sp. TaxID=335381 RepID=UPI0035C9D314